MPKTDNGQSKLALNIVKVSVLNNSSILYTRPTMYMLMYRSFVCSTPSLHVSIIWPNVRQENSTILK